MKPLLIASALALSLGACALPEAQDVRNDFNRARQTNTDGRHEARVDGLNSLAAARRACTQQALKLETENEYDEASKKHLECAKLAADTMPDLLTTELLKQGRDEFRRFRTEEASQ